MTLVNAFVDTGYTGVLVLAGFHGYPGFRSSLWSYDR